LARRVSVPALSPSASERLDISAEGETGKKLEKRGRNKRELRD